VPNDKQLIMDENINPTNKNAKPDNKFYNNEFIKGYQNGVYQASKIDFQSYLENKTRYENLKKEIERKKENLSELKVLIAESKRESSHFYEKMQTHNFNIEVKNNRLGRFNTTFERLNTKLNKLYLEIDNSFEEYSLLAGVIFFAASLVFMIGDLIISHEIVAYALNIRNATEAWLFASGLAALSILLKPVYDRLFEKIYKNSDPTSPPKNYIWLKGTLVIFAILTLFVLGWFRFEAYRINEQKSNLNRVISSLQEDNMSAEAIKQVESLLAQQQSLSTQLVNSLWGLFSFVLTGILFAVSGAICLGIGLPILQFYWRRWMQVPIKDMFLKFRKRRLIRKIEKEEAILAIEKTNYSITNYEFEGYKNIKSLEVDCLNLKVEIDDLEKQKSDAESDYMVSLYLDGYANGEASLISNTENNILSELSNSVKEDTNLKKDMIVRDLNQKNSTKSQTKGHLHLALRQMITDNFYKND